MKKICKSCKVEFDHIQQGRGRPPTKCPPCREYGTRSVFKSEPLETSGGSYPTQTTPALIVGSTLGQETASTKTLQQGQYRCSQFHVWEGRNKAHCSACHLTFSTVNNFYRHRAQGTCRDPLALKPPMVYHPVGDYYYTEVEVSEMKDQG